MIFFSRFDKERKSKLNKSFLYRRNHLKLLTYAHEYTFNLSNNLRNKRREEEEEEKEKNNNNNNNKNT